MSDRTVDKLMLPTPAMLLVCLVVWSPASVLAATDESSRYLELIEAQARLIENLQGRVAALEAREGMSVDRLEQPRFADEAESLPVPNAGLLPRETIGDLRGPVREGSIAESFRIPGPRDISIRFGGFIKSVAYYDSDQETADEYFLPALLGLRSSDESGQYRQSADLSRLAFQADAPVGGDNIKAYVEYEFRNNFNLRHAYLNWQRDKSDLLAGQYWSAFMDLAAIPEGLSEATASGAILARQTQFRFTRALTDKFQWTFSAEDPSSNDVLYEDSPAFQRPAIPDIVNTLTLRAPDVGHVRVGTLLRRLEVNTDVGKDDTYAWGATLSGKLEVGQKDSLIGMVVVGDGLGRYLLGITPLAAGSFDADGSIRTRDNLGGYLGYQHFWSSRFRSNFVIGYAEADNFAGQPDDAFSNSSFAMGNILFQINEHLTTGFEYTYGQRENNDGSDRDNHRIMLSLQLF